MSEDAIASAVPNDEMSLPTPGVDVLNLVEGHVRKISLKQDAVDGVANSTLLAANEVLENSTVYVNLLGVLKNSQKVFLDRQQERAEFIMGQSTSFEKLFYFFPEVFVFSDELPKGLEIGLMSMKVGERALVECSFEYGFQEGQYPNGISPEQHKDEIILYDVTLLAVDKKAELESLSAADKLTLATQRKDEGNKFVEKKDFLSAVSSYQKGLRSIAAITYNQADEEKVAESTIVKLKISLLTNISL
jgi:hypothetical protein